MKKLLVSLCFLTSIAAQAQLSPLPVFQPRALNMGQVIQEVEQIKLMREQRALMEEQRAGMQAQREAFQAEQRRVERQRLEIQNREEAAARQAKLEQQNIEYWSVKFKQLAIDRFAAGKNDVAGLCQDAHKQDFPKGLVSQCLQMSLTMTTYDPSK